MLSIVVPAYNEALYLEAMVHEVTSGLIDRDEPFEMVVVENGSTDQTWTVLEQLAVAQPQLRPLRLSEANYGLALRLGLEAADGDEAVIFDVDFYDLAFLKDAVDLLRAPGGPSIVVGSKRGAGAVDKRAWHRRAVTAAFASVLRALFGLTLPDTHGIKALDLRATRHLVSRCRCRHDLFDTELIVRAERQGLAVDVLPVEVAELRAPRSSISRRIPRTLAGLARLRWALWRDPA